MLHALFIFSWMWSWKDSSESKITLLEQSDIAACALVQLTWLGAPASMRRCQLLSQDWPNTRKSGYSSRIVEIITKALSCLVVWEMGRAPHRITKYIHKRKRRSFAKRHWYKGTNKYQCGLLKRNSLKETTGLVEDKSPGPDGMHPLLLKSYAGSLAGPLAIIFQKSYESGQIPSDW